MITIVVPLAGMGKSFKDAGFALPKPLVDVVGKPIITRVIDNLRPTTPHRFIFVLTKEQYETYPQFAEIFSTETQGNFDVVLPEYTPLGAACSVLTAIDHMSSNDELIIANGDQIVDIAIDDFIQQARNTKAAGFILTFEASRPKWSFVRLNKNHEVIETAEKKIISNHATVGIYYYKKSSLFVNAALAMIEKDIRFNNEFYVCPAYNELILQGEKVLSWEIDRKQMHSLGTADGLAMYLHFLETSYNNRNENSNSNSRKRVTISTSNKSKSRVRKAKTSHRNKR
jgi:dTDP-glucose pyrophosphorylase